MSAVVFVSWEMFRPLGCLLCFRVNIERFSLSLASHKVNKLKRDKEKKTGCNRVSHFFQSTLDDETERQAYAICSRAVSMEEIENSNFEVKQP
jgi:hypothetical protein